MLSTKSYLIRAIYDWCLDAGLTPYLLVLVDGHTVVPSAYVKEGEIVLNLSAVATKHLQINPETITFTARFSGQSQDIYIPISAVRGVYARENGQGMFFEVENSGVQQDSLALQTPKNDLENIKNNPDKPKKPSLKLVK